jgi:hypothetical protein
MIGIDSCAKPTNIRGHVSDWSQERQPLFSQQSETRLTCSRDAGHGAKPTAALIMQPERFSRLPTQILAEGPVISTLQNGRSPDRSPFPMVAEEGRYYRIGRCRRCSFPSPSRFAPSNRCRCPTRTGLPGLGRIRSPRCPWSRKGRCSVFCPIVIWVAVVRLPQDRHRSLSRLCCPALI